MEVNINIRMDPEELAILKGNKSHNGNGKKQNVKAAEGNTQEPKEELGESNSGGINYQDYREEFVEWLYKNVNDDSARQYVRDMDNTLLGVEIEEPNQLAKIFGEKSHHYKIAVRDFLKFLVRNGYYKASEIYDYQNVVKIPTNSVRTNRFTDTDAILKALNTVNGEKSLMIKLLGYTGLRMSEGMLLLENFNEENLEFNGDVACYNMEEIMQLKTKSENNTKNTFDAFMPAEFASKLERTSIGKGKLKGDRLANGIIYANQLRKWHTNFLKAQIREKELNFGVAPETVINYVQGRVSKSILSRHYLDLKEDAVKLYEGLEFPF